MSRTNESKYVTVGREYKSNRCGFLTVVEYVNSKNVKVRFHDTGFEMEGLEAKDIAIGKVADPFAPVVAGFGFSGVGKFSMATHSKIYYIWAAMIQRVYGRPTGRTSVNYEGCVIALKWRNFQNFAHWYTEQPYHRDKGYEIDKDLKIEGNRLYSPETCLLIPKELNSIIGVTSRFNSVANGVSLRKNGSYRARIVKNSVRTTIGTFDTVTEAYQAYIKAHREAVVSLATYLHSKGKILDYHLNLVLRRFS